MNATINSGPWMQTLSGRAVSILNPQPRDVNWRDIAFSLGGTRRFLAHTHAPYSTAQHSLIAADLVESAIKGSAALESLIYATPKDRHDDLRDMMAKARMDDTTARLLVLATLLHDAHEAHLGDIISPVSQAIEFLAGSQVIKQIKTAHDCVIFQAAGLPWPLPESWRLVIKAADMVMLSTEKRDLTADGRKWAGLPRPASFVIKPMAEGLATDLFLKRLHDLMRT